MVGWHNAAGPAPVANWWTDGSNASAFSRGSSAWVAINAESSPVTETFSTGLPAGTYCDIINGTASGGAFAGTTVAGTAAGGAPAPPPGGGGGGTDETAMATAAAGSGSVQETVK